MPDLPKKGSIHTAKIMAIKTVVNKIFDWNNKFRVNNTNSQSSMEFFEVIKVYLI